MTAGQAIACLTFVALLVASHPVAADEASVPNAAAAESVRGMQQRILADPQMAEKVQSLRDDPAVQAVINDPAIAAALARGDISALLADPKIQRLANDPALQDLTRQVGP